MRRAHCPASAGWRRFSSQWLEAEREQLPPLAAGCLAVGICAWFVLPGPEEWVDFADSQRCLHCGACPGVGDALGAVARYFLLCRNAWLCTYLVEGQQVAAPRLEYARMAEFVARVETVQRLSAKQTVRLLVRPVNASDLPTRLRINVDEDKAIGVTPGAVIHLKAWLMPPPPMAVPGAYDFSRTAWFQGIGGTGRALGVVDSVQPAGEQGWAARIASVRQGLANHIMTRLPGNEGGIAVALVTGDQGAIEEEDAEAIRRSGLAHLLSVWACISARWSPG